MTEGDYFRGVFASIQVSGDFAAATVTMSDDSLLELCHRVGERWARVPADAPAEAAARRVLAAIKQFRLNAKHLDILFADGSQWEARFR